MNKNWKLFQYKDYLLYFNEFFLSKARNFSQWIDCSWYTILLFIPLNKSEAFELLETVIKIILC